VSTSTVEKRNTLPAGDWALDSVHSQVGFAVDYHVGTFRGTFSPVTARLEVADDGTARLTGSAPVTGVRVQDENLTAHLLSPEFFDADRTPEITFSSAQFEQSGDEVEIAGELTIKGTRLPIRAHGTVGEQTDVNGRRYFGLNLEAEVDRTQYGLNWNNPLPNGEPALANDVSITAELYWTKD
jgi:polyisoprenoid-binding protein YceI